MHCDVLPHLFPYLSLSLSLSLTLLSSHTRSSQVLYETVHVHRAGVSRALLHTLRTAHLGPSSATAPPPAASAAAPSRGGVAGGGAGGKVLASPHQVGRAALHDRGGGILWKEVAALIGAHP